MGDYGYTIRIMIRHVTIVQGKRAVYWERNPQQPQTMVLLHGFRGNHKGLTDFAQELDEYRLIIPDLPGYGESEALVIEHSLLNYANWLDQFVAAIGLHDWISWSHSYSGSIALIQAATGAHKPAAVVGVSVAAVRGDAASMAATFYYWFGTHMPASLQRHWVASRMIDHATGRWLFTTVTAKRREELMHRGDANLRELNPQVVTEEYMSSLTTDLEPYASSIHVPVLLIAGAKDVIVPVRRLADLVALMPNGHLSIMKEEGHLAPIEEPATCATLTRKFLHVASVPVAG